MAARCRSACDRQPAGRRALVGHQGAVRDRTTLLTAAHRGSATLATAGRKSFPCRLHVGPQALTFDWDERHLKRSAEAPPLLHHLVGGGALRAAGPVCACAFVVGEQQVALPQQKDRIIAPASVSVLRQDFRPGIGVQLAIAVDMLRLYPDRGADLHHAVHLPTSLSVSSCHEVCPLAGERLSAMNLSASNLAQNPSGTG